MNIFIILFLEHHVLIQSVYNQYKYYFLYNQYIHIYCTYFIGEFLTRMGIIERLEQLIELPTTTEEQAIKLIAAFRRLVGGIEEKGLGERFKVLAISNSTIKVDGFDHNKHSFSKV